MSTSQDINGLKLEIKSLKEDIDFYKSRLEVAEFKLKQQSLESLKQNSELKKKLTHASTKSASLEDKTIKSQSKEIKSLTIKNSILTLTVAELKQAQKDNSRLKKYTNTSVKKIKDSHIATYLARLIEDIIDDDGNLMPSVAMRIRGYTKQLKDGADLAVTQPLLEELIKAYNDTKQAEKTLLLKKKK